MLNTTKPTGPADAECEKSEQAGETSQTILDFGSAMTRTPHGNVYCLSVIGQIEGHTTASNQTKTTKYEHILPLLANIEEGIVFSRDGDVIWQCGNCGHIQIGKKAPAICPVCDHAQAYFRIEAVNY